MDTQPPKISFTSGGVVFYVKYEAASTVLPGHTDKNSITIEESVDDINSLVTVSFVVGEEFKFLFFYCSLDESGRNFGLLYSSATNTLLMGGGKLSVAVNIQSMKIIRETINSCMFYHFEEIGNHVVEFGELDCFLYTLGGDMIDQCPVDPPYEHEVHEGEIKFRSPVFGQKSLKFNRSAATQ